MTEPPAAQCKAPSRAAAAPDVQLAAQKVAQKVRDQVDPVTPSEVNDLIKMFPGQEKEAGAALNYLVQIGGREHMTNVAMKLIELERRGYKIFNPGSTSSVDRISYLSKKGALSPAGSFNTTEVFTKSREPIAVLLDEASLRLYEQRPGLLQSLLANGRDVKLVCPLGLGEGVDQAVWDLPSKVSQQISGILAKTGDSATAGARSGLTEGIISSAQREVSARLSKILPTTANSVEFVVPSCA